MTDGVPSISAFFLKTWGADRHEPLDQENGGADFGLVGYVFVRGDRQRGWRVVPSCRDHGAMNKVSPSDRGGLWRCLQGKCRAGCKEKQLTADEEKA